MNAFTKGITFLVFVLNFSHISSAQDIIQKYNPLKKDSIRIGNGENDFLPYIQSGYTLMLPKNKSIKGVLIFLEDSGYDKKNSNAIQIYNQASEKDFAVLSVSSDIPFDFYFSNMALRNTHLLLEKVFQKYNLPNKNIFYLGGSLVGHRAMRYIQFLKEGNLKFQTNTKGIVICNFTLDWTRKWYQHQRDIRINRINLWEPKFINYMLETYLEGTPRTVPDRYHNFSSYSFFDENNKNIQFYKDYAIRAYAEPKIKYRLTKYFRTLYENNTTDIVGFLAELRLAGNKNTELIVLHQEDDTLQGKKTQTTWDYINKDELMEWILLQVEK